LIFCAIDATFSLKKQIVLCFFHWLARHCVIKVLLQKEKFVLCFHEVQARYSLVRGHHGGSKRLIVVEMMLSIGSDTCFYVGKWEFKNSLRRLCPEMQT